MSVVDAGFAIRYTGLSGMRLRVAALAMRLAFASAAAIRIGQIFA
jgi:hypothetical protein